MEEDALSQKRGLQPPREALDRLRDRARSLEELGR